ncbi:MAG TPA: tautomerase family protein [Gemmataceae bacterium]|nr:tautomerase family protein [Gemmataceae bacterium]
MPHVRIETRKGWIGDRRAEVLEAVHSAMVEALKIPRADRVLRIIESEPADFPTPPGHGERFTIIEITMFAGRSLDAKRRLYAAIARNLEGLGVPPNDVNIVLHEPPLENWGIRGGVPASELDLGFQVRV